MADEVHVGDRGTVFRVTVLEQGQTLDVSTSTNRTLYFRKPVSDTVLSVPAVFTTDGTDGNIEYVIQSGDLDEAGCWRVQAVLTFPGDALWSGEVGDFMVYPNLY